MTRWFGKEEAGRDLQRRPPCEVVRYRMSDYGVQCRREGGCFPFSAVAQIPEVGRVSTSQIPMSVCPLFDCFGRSGSALHFSPHSAPSFPRSASCTSHISTTRISLAHSTWHTTKFCITGGEKMFQNVFGLTKHRHTPHSAKSCSPNLNTSADLAFWKLGQGPARPLRKIG